MNFREILEHQVSELQDMRKLLAQRCSENNKVAGCPTLCAEIVAISAEIRSTIEAAARFRATTPAKGAQKS